jgi:hypothetical protein
MIKIYSANGARYLWVIGFKRNQYIAKDEKDKQSLIPPYAEAQSKDSDGTSEELSKNNERASEAQSKDSDGTSSYTDNLNTDNLNTDKPNTESSVPSAAESAGKSDPKPTASSVIGLWNARLGPLGFPCVKKSTPARERGFGARMCDAAERQRLSWWEALISRMEQSSFFRESAQGHPPWLCFDWILSESNLVKVSEGKYDDRGPPKGGPEWRDGTPEELEEERRRQELRAMGFRGDPGSPGDIAAWERHLARQRQAEGGGAGGRQDRGDNADHTLADRAGGRESAVPLETG